MASWIYGLGSSSHGFDNEEVFGKNIFTNAFPLAVSQYLSIEKQLPIIQIKAATKTVRVKDTVVVEPTTEHEKVQWSEIIGCDPRNAYFDFEEIFEGYKRYTNGTPNRSDVVVCENASTKKHLRPLEIKLVVIPTSGTAKKPKREQSCEIVCRPSTIEQLAFSIAHSYGEDGKQLMQQTILKSIPNPMDFRWSDEDYMVKHGDKVVAAAKGIIKNGLDNQTPLVLTAVWRTEGQSPILDENAFDAFVWTDLAFLQLFTDSKFVNGGKKPSVSRPGRTLCWLVKSLLDWSLQGTLQFGTHHSNITFGTQTDKAGAFSGTKTSRHMKSTEFTTPRLPRQTVSDLLNDKALSVLLPERRLDAALAIEKYKQEAVAVDRARRSLEASTD